MKAGREESWARHMVRATMEEIMLAFLEQHQDIARVPDFGALILTTFTAKTYTTQHDGGVFGFI